MSLTNNNILKRFKKITDVYSDGKNMSEIFEVFSCLSQDFENIKVKDFNYSSYDFLKCSKDEQETFFNDQLQFIECLVTNSIYDKSGLVWIKFVEKLFIQLN